VDVKKENHQLRGALEGLRASADVRLAPAQGLLPRRSSKQLSRSSFGAKAREQEAAEAGAGASDYAGSATTAAASSGSGGDHRRLSAAAVRTAAEAPSFFV
jgi:hypothetical protein